MHAGAGRLPSPSARRVREFAKGVEELVRQIVCTEREGCRNAFEGQCGRGRDSPWRACAVPAQGIHPGGAVGTAGARSLLATSGGGGAPRSLLGAMEVAMASSRWPSASWKSAVAKWLNHDNWLRRLADRPSVNPREGRARRAEVRPFPGRRVRGPSRRPRTTDGPAVRPPWRLPTPLRTGLLPVRCRRTMPRGERASRGR